MTQVETTPAAANDGTDHAALANCIRALSIDAVERAASGHPGAPMGMADAATVLASRHLKFDAADPWWPDRDRLVLSNGHASMLLYSLLYLTGYADMPLEELRNFRQWGSRTAGHPEFGHAGGIETTTGPLGQGLANAVGMAMAERALAHRFGAGAVDHRTWVFCGDGCLMEGIGQEAISLAGHLGLGKLILMYDDNGISIDGDTAKAFSEDIPARFRACHWHTASVDGHDPAALDAALDAAKAETGAPSLIAMKTTIGFGAPTKAGTAAAHGSPLGAEEADAAKAALGWHAAPFEIPEPQLTEWRRIGSRGAEARAAWQSRIDAMPDAERAEFQRRLAGELPDGYEAAVAAAHEKLLAEPGKLATRKASEAALATLTEVLPEMIGGSADLTGSNNTRPAAMDTDFTAAAPGRYVSYGVREFAMAAAMNGMAAHGGVIPYGGTFLCFADYCRNAIRLAALSRFATIFVMTHDSIGLGEDGPTHQPIEHLAGLRAVPGLHVYRPADPVETLECWDLAVRDRDTPALLALSRQGTPQLRTEAHTNLSARGAYVLREAAEKRDVTVLATGTEVSLAVEAAETLAAEGLAAAVVSMPCWERFEAEGADYRRAVLGTAPRVAVEAAGKLGWTRYVAHEDDVIGMDGFGASAPGGVAYEKFGITAAAVAARARDRAAHGEKERP